MDQVRTCIPGPAWLVEHVLILGRSCIPEELPLDVEPEIIFMGLQVNQMVEVHT